MEQEIMDRSLLKQRAGIVQKQVAAGREFKVNRTFYNIQSFEKTLSLTGYATTRLAGTGVWVKITEAINF
jgi:hypothetical protein